MIIAIDASRACKSQRTGIEYYSLALFENWKNLKIKDHLIFFAPCEPPDELKDMPLNWTWEIIPAGRLWSQYKLLHKLKKTKHDCLFVPSHIIPAFYKGIAITMIHDLGYIERPDLYDQNETFYQKWANSMSLKASSGIITPSDYSKKSLVKWKGIEPQKIKTIYHGYRQDLFYPKDGGELPKDVKKPYIYFVGRIEKKKNIQNMLEAYKYLRNERKISHQFILAGKEGFGAGEIKQYWKSLPENIQKDIIFLDYVDDSTNSILMRNADIFFFTSWIEGFGFPIIEAMASGVPVICSNTSSLKEIAGNSAILVDPDKPFSMAAALSKIINNLKLKELVIRAGLHQAKRFNWQRTAEETLDYIRLVALRENKS